MKQYLQKLVLYPYYAFRTLPQVKAFLDGKALKLHALSRPALDQDQKKILSGLNENGIASTSLEALFGKNNAKEILQYYLKAKDQAETKKTKSFLYATKTLELDIESHLVKFSLNNKILDIANEYLGLWSLLRYAEYTETIPAKDGATAKGSQNWHRDPGTGLICKAFIYLTDVNEIKDGPFTYIAGTHAKGKWKNIFPMNKYRKAGYVLSGKDVGEFLKDNNAESDVISAIGKAGTVIFADTLGIHKGGYTLTEPRIMTITLFEPPSSLGGRNYKAPAKDALKGLNSPASYALTKKIS